jgi:phosphotriesterase-related protein
MITRRTILKTGAVAAVTTATSLFAACTSSRPLPPQTKGGRSVETVTGPVDVSRSRWILTHEHVCLDPMETYGDKQTALSEAVRRLEQAREAGIDVVIDATSFDIRRDVAFGREASLKSGMHIVASTGQHLYAPPSFNKTLEELADFFVQELVTGIDGTGIKAGVIKVASAGEAMAPAEEKAFKAAAWAHAATGAPIITHSNSRLHGGIQQADLLEAESVDPGQVIIGHSNDTDDLPYLEALAKRGFMLGMDHMFWGNAAGASLSSQARGEIIVRLIEAGYASQIVLSNDWVLGDSDRDKVNPDGLLYTLRKTLPYLRARGVTEADIQAITMENPKRWLTSASSAAAG